ncbi:alpha/beta hydrolase [Streptomyces sp. NPDC003015]
MDESQMLAEAVARAWQDDLPGRHDSSQIASDLLPMLRELEAIPDEQAERLHAEIRNLVKAHPALAEQIRDELDLLILLTERGPSRSGPDRAEELRHRRHVLVELAYATDRRPLADAEAGRWYGTDRGELSFGTASVSVPDDHRMGKLDRPRGWPLRFSADRKRFLEVVDVRSCDAVSFVAASAEKLRRAPEPDLLVFVHGYNVSFIDAVRRAAQIAYDLDFQGVPLLYSWPSEASTSSYFVDGENAEWAQPHFQAFLNLVLTSTGSRRVHIVAHSMGNRILTDALTAVDGTLLPPGSARLGQVIFAAPDVDSGVFVQRAQRFVSHAEGYTLYVSGKDQALNMSQRFVRHPRAGQAGDGIVVVDGVDTIDVTDLDTGLMSHSYVGSHRSVVSDLYYLLHRGHRPSDRFGLRPVVSPAGIYWVFRS